jgi:hypothetical protein
MYFLAALFFSWRMPLKYTERRLPPAADEFRFSVGLREMKKGWEQS